MATIPYIPAKALLSPVDDALVYVLQPPTSTTTSAQLLALNTTRRLHAASLPLATVTNPLPFLKDSIGETPVYTPAIDSNGNIYTYVGSCDGKGESSDLWVFQPLKQASGESGQWTRSNISRSEFGVARLPGHLAAAVAFSSSNYTTDVFVFGGMCPNRRATSTDDWTFSANYSNSVLLLKSDPPSRPPRYELMTSSNRSPPVAEAGFTLTPLRPSFTPPGDGEQVITQNYVLLGGHTHSAFINMSQVALLSLPEQSWSFLPVEEPGEKAKTELTARDGLLVEPRSGHTAVLTSDGKRIVMYGGWVGDLHTAAHPQLAVLELGEAYGGKGNWQWSIPDLDGAGPEEGTGTYGHGAVMLPGDVMMIIGGYSTSSQNSAKNKRAGLVENTNAYFLNTTSYSWISEYTHPKMEANHSASATPGSRSITASKRAGLSAGLVFGILAVIAIVILYFWYARRLMRKRAAHAEDLRNLGSGYQRAHWSALDTDGQERAISQRDLRDAYSWTTQNSADAQSHPANGGAPAQRTGLLFEIPSPTRGLRRSLHSRGAYQPAPRYDDSRMNRSSGNIHPIDERDEYESEGTAEPTLEGTGRAHGRNYHILNSAPVFDPFQDPSEGSRSPSPHSPARERQLEVQRWINDWAAADARINQHAGRLSPDKTDRTSSTLSENSMRSNCSGHSIGSFSRSMSQRSAALFSHANTATNPTATPSPANELYNAAWITSDSRPEQYRSQSLTTLPRRATTSDAIGSGAASVRPLQLESDALMGGYADAASLSPRRTQSRAKGWVGSMRRAFGGDRTAPTSPEHGSSGSSSPTKFHHNIGVPQRAASAGTTLWQKRQGAKDWDAEEGPGKRRTDEGSKMNAGDEEWDVESAVERRVVQVMFTVPRAKLRVVNGAAEGDGDSVISSETKGAEKEADGHGNGKGKGNEDGEEVGG